MPTGSAVVVTWLLFLVTSFTALSILFFSQLLISKGIGIAILVLAYPGIANLSRFMSPPVSVPAATRNRRLRLAALALSFAGIVYLTYVAYVR